MKTINDNRTKLYRIRRKEDGMFLVHLAKGTPYSIDGTWNAHGVFWKKPETIRKHLLELIQFRVYDGHGIDHYWPGKPVKAIYPYDVPIRHVKTVYEWLEKYEVVATEVTIHSENRMEAKDFASFQPIDGTIFARAVV